MKIAITILTIVCAFLTCIIILNDKAWMYKFDQQEKENAKQLALQDSVHKVMYDRILKGNYKPNKVNQ